jgi:ribosomal protein L29
MGRLKLRTLREFNDDDLESKLSEIRADLLKLRNMKWKRRDIARILSILKERELAK